MDLHRRAARVREDVGDALPFQGLNEDVCAFAGLVVAESSGNLRLLGGGGGNGGVGSGGFGEGTCDVERGCLAVV